MPVEGAERALAAQPGPGEDPASVPLSLTPAEMGRVVFDGVRKSNAFSEIVEAPAPGSGGAGGDALSAAADFARRTNADLLLRITVRSARVRDLGNNGSTFWSTFTWFMLPLPVWSVDDRTYETNLAVEAQLYEPRDVVKPTASVVATSGRHDLDLWDRGPSLWVAIVPPPFLKGDPKTVSESVTERAVAQLMEKLVEDLRTRPIPTRFELSIEPRDGGVAVTAASRRQLRSLEVFVDGRPLGQWAETDLVPEADSTADRRVYRRSVAVPGAASARREVRVVAEDEAGGREVRTIVLGDGRGE